MTDEQIRKFDDLSIKLMIERGYASVDEITPAEIVAILDECRTEEK